MEREWSYHVALVEAAMPSTVVTADINRHPKVPIKSWMMKERGHMCSSRNVKGNIKGVFQHG